MKRQIIIIISALSVCALLFGIYFAITLSSDKDTDDTDDKENAEELIELNKVEKISAFSIEGEDISLSLIRHNGHWHLSDNQSIPLSDSAVSSLISSLEYITVIRTVSEHSENYSEYGLDTPSYTLKFTLDGNERTYLFGDQSEYYSGRYFSSSATEGVSIISSSFLQSFIVELETLLEFDSLPDLSAIDSIELTGTSGKSVQIALESCSGDELKLFESLATLEIDRYIDCGSDVFDTYGLDNCATLIIDGEIELKLAEGESPEIVYLLIGQSELIYLVKCDDLEGLIEFINY